MPEAQIKFSMVDNLKVSIAQSKSDDIVIFVVKLSCEAPLNVVSEARLINMAKANVPMSVTFTSGQLVMDMKVDSIDLNTHFLDGSPRPDRVVQALKESALPKDIIGDQPKDDRLAQALGEGGSKEEEVTAPGNNGDGPKRRGRPKKAEEEAVGAGA